LAAKNLRAGAAMTTFLGLPTALAQFAKEKRWVVWRWEITNKGKRTKPPYRADRPNEKASSTNPKTWCDFDTALATYHAGKADGVGLCLFQSPLSAFDLDDCRDSTSGNIEPAARRLIERAHSYVEITVSGSGLRILLTGTGGKIHRKQAVPGANGMTVETYRQAERFVVVTGNALPEATAQLANGDALMEEVVAKLDEAAKKARGKNDGKSKQGGKRNLNLDDIIRNGERGHFNGDRSRAVWWAINEMLRRGDVPNAIVATLLNRKTSTIKPIPAIIPGSRLPRPPARRIGREEQWTQKQLRRAISEMRCSACAMIPSYTTCSHSMRCCMCQS
jgi:hypothetical protein